MVDSDHRNENEHDALCPECGHAFKVFVDRLLENPEDDIKLHADCPVCGCGECRIG
jgi:C4-type Zn-finger protein